MQPARPGSRRHADQDAGVRLVATVRALVRRLDAVAGGRWLLLLTGTGVWLGAPLLEPSRGEWIALAAVSVAMIGVLAASVLVDWAALPERATLAFPLAVFAGLGALSMTAPGFTVAVTGLLAGAYVYTGLTQRPGTSMVVVPVGTAAFVIMNGGLSGPILVRALIAAMVWTTVVEILAAFTHEQRRLNSALLDAAMSDALTGVPNRRDLDLRLTTVTPGDTVVVCDLDHFKRLNDIGGHHAGDRVLADFGMLLRSQLRSTDYCARYGGEEFVLVLPDTSPTAARALVRRLHAAWAVMDCGTTFSTGIAICRGDRPTAATLAAADAALYAAKAAGRDTDRLEVPVLTSAAGGRR